MSKNAASACPRTVGGDTSQAELMLGGAEGMMCGAELILGGAEGLQRRAELMLGTTIRGLRGAVLLLGGEGRSRPGYE